MVLPSCRKLVIHETKGYNHDIPLPEGIEILELRENQTLGRALMVLPSSLKEVKLELVNLKELQPFDASTMIALPQLEKLHLKTAQAVWRFDGLNGYNMNNLRHITLEGLYNTYIAMDGLAFGAEVEAQLE